MNKFNKFLISLVCVVVLLGGSGAGLYFGVAKPYLAIQQEIVAEQTAATELLEQVNTSLALVDEKRQQLLNLEGLLALALETNEANSELILGLQEQIIVLNSEIAYWERIQTRLEFYKLAYGAKQTDLAFLRGLFGTEINYIISNPVLPMTTFTNDAPFIMDIFVPANNVTGYHTLDFELRYGDCLLIGPKTANNCFIAAAGSNSPTIALGGTTNPAGVIRADELYRYGHGFGALLPNTVHMAIVDNASYFLPGAIITLANHWGVEVVFDVIVNFRIVDA